MRLISRQSSLLFSTNNLSDIAANYTPLSRCERVQEVARQAYLSATDYHK